MLDLTKPVYIKAQIIDKKDQSIFPIDMERPYNALTIPEEFRTELYLTNDNGRRKVALSPEEILTPPVEAPIIETPAPSPKKANATPPVVS